MIRQSQNFGVNDSDIRQARQNIDALQRANNARELSVNAGDLTLLNGWTQNSATTRPVTVKYYADGWVCFSGALDASSVSSSSGSQSDAFIIPQDIAPKAIARFLVSRSVDRSLALAFVEVETDGTVSAYFTTGDDQIILDQVFYRIT